MAFDSSDALARHYAALLAEHGDGPRAAGYLSAHGQQVGFMQMARVDGLAPGARVLDVGCGVGALGRFLDGRGLRVAYTGWDLSAPVIAEARRREPGATFEVRDIVRDPPAERHDFVFACGTLSLLLPDHLAWTRAMVKAMWEACDRAVVFTLLSARGSGPRLDGYFYADPAAILADCFALTGQVVLDHAEMAHGFAVYLYRRNPAPVERMRKDFGEGDVRAIVEHYSSLGLPGEALSFVAGLPESADNRDTEARLAFETGDQERMVAAFARAAELEPDRGERWRRLAAALARAGRAREALAPLDRALALPSDDETRRWAELLRAALAR